MNNSQITLTKIMAINTKINEAKEAMKLARQHNNNDLAQSFRGEVFGMQDTLAIMLDMNHAQLKAYLDGLNEKQTARKERDVLLEELTAIQNQPENQSRDIMTIAGMMSLEALKAHVNNNRSA